MSEFVAPAAGADFQYESAGHQARTAMVGMWLFLATELLFFGALFYLWLLLRYWHPDGFKAAASDSDLLIGTINTVLLATTSFTYLWGLQEAKSGRNRQTMWALLATAGIGAVFVALKLFEWSEDVGKGRVPGLSFHTTGPDPGGQHLFWLLYYAGTSLHVVHMLIGILLVCWIAFRARRNQFSGDYHTPVEAVGLYWTFVDMVWVNLYAFIYVLDR